MRTFWMAPPKKLTMAESKPFCWPINNWSHTLAMDSAVSTPPTVQRHICYKRRTESEPPSFQRGATDVKTLTGRIWMGGLMMGSTVSVVIGPTGAHAGVNMSLSALGTAGPGKALPTDTNKRPPATIVAKRREKRMLLWGLPKECQKDKCVPLEDAW